MLYDHVGYIPPGLIRESYHRQVDTQKPCYLSSFKNRFCRILPFHSSQESSTTGLSFFSPLRKILRKGRPIYHDSYPPDLYKFLIISGDSP